MTCLTPKTTKAVQYVTVDSEFAGQRIDNFLFNELKNVPKSRVYKMLRSGEVRVNKKRVQALYKIQSGDIIRVPPFWAKDKNENKRPKDELVSLLKSSIIFEDKKVLAINKPVGIPVHSGSGVDFGVIETLRFAKPELKNLELVHRLDRETSGCLILAKTRAALLELHKLIHDGKIKKTYILLVKGKWDKGDKFIVDASLMKNILQGGERMVKVGPEGKKAITIFRPLKIGKDISLIEAELKTGRTHQIRVHAAHIGYPIVGDDKYGDVKFNAIMKRKTGKRMFLHSESLSFCWEDGQEINIISDVSDVWQKMVRLSW
jgi:23S rRNA pseudouridine955/2504/2580 synthase